MSFSYFIVKVYRVTGQLIIFFGIVLSLFNNIKDIPIMLTKIKWCIFLIGNQGLCRAIKYCYLDLLLLEFYSFPQWILLIIPVLYTFFTKILVVKLILFKTWQQNQPFLKAL